METQALEVRPKELFDVVRTKISRYIQNGELEIPPDYPVEASLKYAWLSIQEAKDKNGAPALHVCNKTSIANALLDMIIQGLNPARDQCYFVVFGNHLVCMRSYFGTMALARRLCPDIKEIHAEVVYEDDVFVYAFRGGKKEIIEHSQMLENIHPDKIRAAYCTVYWKDGRVTTEVMTIDEIKQCWKQSPIKPIDDKNNIKPGTVHANFTAEMCKRTVINRCLKPIIKGATDNWLVHKAVERQDEIAAEALLEEQMKEANQEILDLPTVKEQSD